MDPAAFLRDARHYAHRYVESSDRFRCQRFSRAELIGATFLTDAELGPRLPHTDVPCEQALQLLPDRSPALLFHSAFCGSTLLAKALTATGRAIGLSEPVVLNDLVGWRLRGAESPALARAMDGALRLLAREFDPGERVVVKPSNLVNPLAELMLALHPTAKAVFLYAPLETFLISVARKGIACRAWVRELAEAYLKLGMFRPLGISAADAFRQTDLQIAATGWLAQHVLFHRLVTTHGADRLRTLDADRMMTDPAGALAGVATHFALGVARPAVDAITAGPVFSRHAKSGDAFDPNARAGAYARTLESYRDEIETVVTWAGAVARQCAVPFDLPSGLL